MMTKKYKLPLDYFKLTSIGRSNRIPRNRGTLKVGLHKCTV